MNEGVAHHEGCHVYGWLDVKRVAANFHISVHVEDYMMLAQVRLASCIWEKPILTRPYLYCNHCPFCLSQASLRQSPTIIVRRYRLLKALSVSGIRRPFSIPQRD